MSSKHLTYFAIVVSLGAASASLIDIVNDGLTDKNECRLTILAESQRKFALELYKKVSREEGANRNVALSPVVINMALSMLLMGATNETEKDMLKAMFYEGYINGEEDKEEISCIFTRYKTAPSNSLLTLHLASKLFADNGQNIQNSFQESTQLFGSEMERVDFKFNAEQARSIINNWVYQNTERRIADMFPSGSFDSLTKLVMATALYFKGSWLNSFTTLRNGTFQVSDNIEVETTYMKEDITTHYTYNYQNNMELLELPYASAGDVQISFIAIQNVYSNDYREVENAWTPTSLQQAISDLFASDPIEVSVKMPMFEIHADYDMKPSLQAMGLGGLFQQGAANLHGITGQENDLFLNNFKHKTFFKVDQTGSEAAASAGAEFGVLSLRPNVVLYKPFHYILYEKATKTILFIGRVMNPNL